MAERVERRLAAILAADVVGYSRLMDADEEATLAALNSHMKEFIEPTIAEHQGRIVKLMGDGVLAEFPSAVDAMRCALVIQRGMPERATNVPEDKRIVFRIGVNVGDAIVQGDDIYGGGVNVAARLETLADAGGILASGTAYDQVVGKLDCGFEFIGEQAVKNIEQPVRAYRVILDAGAGTGSARRQRWTTRQQYMAAAVCGALILALGAIGWLQFSKSNDQMAVADGAPLAPPSKPSIAVLPFDNMSNDPDQDYFVDGLVEDIITELSRNDELFVIARNASFAYRDKPIDLKQIAHELGVRYLLEGSIRYSKSGLQVTAQLIEASTGNHVWAERYDRDADDLFAVQADVTRNIVATLATKVSAAEIQASLEKSTENLTAYDLVKRGIWHRRKFNVEGIGEAERSFRKAIDIDPDYADAWVHLGLAITVDVIFHLTGRTHDDLDEAHDLIKKGIKLKPDLPVAYYALGILEDTRSRFDEALAASQRAVDLNPNDANYWQQLSRAQMNRGFHDKAITSAELALRLNPSEPSWYLHDYGLALYAAEKYQEAEETFKACIRRYDDSSCMRKLPVALVRQSKLDEARQAMRKALEVRTEFSMQSIRPDHYGDPEMMERYVEDLRAAGLPETPPTTH